MFISIIPRESQLYNSFSFELNDVSFICFASWVLFIILFIGLCQITSKRLRPLLRCMLLLKSAHHWYLINFVVYNRLLLSDLCASLRFLKNRSIFSFKLWYFTFCSCEWFETNIFSGRWRRLWILRKTTIGNAVLCAELLRRIRQCRWYDERRRDIDVQLPGLWCFPENNVSRMVMLLNNCPE